MTQPTTYDFHEKRQYFRINFDAPFQFKSVAAQKASELDNAQSQNISQAGILFQTKSSPPKLSSILWMNVDIRTLSICQEIERRALIVKNGIFGKVVRVEEDADNNTVYDVGVCFLTKDQKDSKEVQAILGQLTQAK